MKIYIAIWNDQHSDITAHPFSDPDNAVEWAKAKAKECVREPEDYEEHDYGRDSGWIFYANYSCEGDNVRVVTTDLDGEI